MAGQTIKGITIELGGSTTKLGKALKSVEGYSKDLESQLKDVEKALKLDPYSTELLSQKQRILGQQVENTREKLDMLKKAQEEAAKSVDNYDAWLEAYTPIQEQIDKTKKKLTELQAEQKKMERAGEIDTESYQNLSAEIDDLKDDLKDLHDQSKKVSEQFGNPISTKEFERLQTEIAITETNLKNARKEADKVGDKLKAIDSGELREVKDAADKAKQSLKGAKDEAVSFGDILKADVISEAAGRMMDTVGNLVDETKEYRKIMGSLEVSSEAAGYTAEQTQEAYKALYGVLADDQSAATTVANLQAVAHDQEELLALIDVTTGAWAKYGDSIPIDSLAEAINETAKTGQVTGVLADVLNWGTQESESFGVQLKDITELESEYEALTAKGTDTQKEYIEQLKKKMAACESIEELVALQEKYNAATAEGSDTSEEYVAQLKAQIDAATAWNDSITGATSADAMFNLRLQQCSSETERLGLIMQVMADQGLANVGQKWKENNATLVESNEVNADLQEQLALLGEMIEPITTDITEMLVEVLGWFNGLDDGTQKFLLGTLALIAALGPVGSAFGGVSDIVKLLSDKDLPNLTSVFGTITGTVLPGVGNAFSSVFGYIAANPVVFLIGAIVAAGAAIAIWGDDLQKVLQNADDYMQDVFAKDWTETFGPVLGGIMNSFMDDLKNWWDAGMNFFNGIIDFIRGVFTLDFERAGEGIREIFSGCLDGILALAGTNIEEVEEAFSKGIEKIKGFFSGWEWKWPKLKMPHFNVTGGFDFTVFPPAVPKIGVEWYAEGGILNGAQIFGALGNTLLGGGEAGPEAVLPLESFYDNLRDILTQLVGSPSVGNSIQVILNIEHFENSREQDIDELADDLAERFQFKIQQKEAGL